MAQINKQPLLSICIPIYNRLYFLERQLERMSEDKDLFEEQIQLIVSDNCSTDDLKSCCEKYQQQGLKLVYNRNETNIGPDGNFAWCFHHAGGKYVWLLGSDDIPLKGLLRNVVEQLAGGDYGLVHLTSSSRRERLKIYHHDESILADINVWITFISANIIRAESVRDYDLSEFIGSFMIQVPAYLNACLTTDDNALIYISQLFEKDSDTANNGGYNLFQVFVENLFGMYQRFIDKGLLSQQAFEKTKKEEYRTWLVGFVVDLLILKKAKRNNFDVTNSWSILFNHYGRHSYFYYFTLVQLVLSIAKSVACPVYRLIKRIL
jgi:glycosyltransferase involved in cell wall biosynthesis